MRAKATAFVLMLFGFSGLAVAAGAAAGLGAVRRRAVRPHLPVGADAAVLGRGQRQRGG